MVGAYKIRILLTSSLRASKGALALPVRAGLLRNHLLICYTFNKKLQRRLKPEKREFMFMMDDYSCEKTAERLERVYEVIR